MLLCTERKWVLASASFACASLLRSNGVLLSGFLIWGILIEPFITQKSKADREVTAFSRFKVSKLTSGAARGQSSSASLMWVGTDHTNLVQEGAVHTLLPVHMRSFQSNLPLCPSTYLSPASISLKIFVHVRLIVLIDLLPAT